MEDAGGTGGFLLAFGISSDSSDSLGCEMMQTKVHPAIEGLCFPLCWVPFLWSMLDLSIPDGGERHRPLALLPCPVGTPDAGPEETPRAEQWLGTDEDTTKRELGEG